MTDDETLTPTEFAAKLEEVSACQDNWPDDAQAKVGEIYDELLAAYRAAWEARDFSAMPETIAALVAAQAIITEGVNLRQRVMGLEHRLRKHGIDPDEGVVKFTVPVNGIGDAMANYRRTNDAMVDSFEYPLVAGKYPGGDDEDPR